MSDVTNVNAAAMSQGIDDLKQAHSRVEDDLHTLESELQSSLQHWEGNAREAYTGAKATWDGAAAHMSQVIATMGSTMSTINDAYTDNESRIASTWG